MPEAITPKSAFEIIAGRAALIARDEDLLSAWNNIIDMVAAYSEYGRLPDPTTDEAAQFASFAVDIRADVKATEDIISAGAAEPVSIEKDGEADEDTEGAALTDRLTAFSTVAIWCDELTPRLVA